MPGTSHTLDITGKTASEPEVQMVPVCSESNVGYVEFQKIEIHRNV